MESDPIQSANGDSTTERTRHGAGDVIVREAIAGDAARISALLGVLGYPSTEQIVARRIGEFPRGEGDRVFVAVDGEVCGFLSFHIIPCFHADGALGRITAMAVDPNSQRRGVGRRLIDAAEAFAWSRGCERIEVTSSDYRLGAHAFYESMGYHRNVCRFIKSRA